MILLWYKLLLLAYFYRAKSISTIYTSEKIVCKNKGEHWMQERTPLRGEGNVCSLAFSGIMWHSYFIIIIIIIINYNHYHQRHYTINEYHYMIQIPVNPGAIVMIVLHSK